MQLEAQQLPFSLEKALLPVYLVSGDEPLQQGEAVDLVREKAKAAGFINREVFHVDAKFDWNQVFAACLSQSLFADKNLIELNIPSAKPGREGSAAIDKVVANLSQDNILIIITGKVDKASKSTRWFKTIDQHGVAIAVWPLANKKLEQWLHQRLQQKGMSTNQQGVKFLAECVEGNLLAAAQEIEKLQAIYGAGVLSIEQLGSAVADNSRYDIFKLMESLLASNLPRVLQILQALKAEKLATPILLWAVLRELRLLAALSFEKASTGRTDITFKKNRTWDTKKAEYLKLLAQGNLEHWHRLISMSAKAEKIIKGVESGNDWLILEQICIAICRPNLARNGALPA